MRQCLLGAALEETRSSTCNSLWKWKWYVRQTRASFNEVFASIGMEQPESINGWLASRCIAHVLFLRKTRTNVLQYTHYLMIAHLFTDGLIDFIYWTSKYWATIYGRHWKDRDAFKTSLYTQNNSGYSEGCSSVYLQTMSWGCPRGVCCELWVPRGGITLGMSRNLQRMPHLNFLLLKYSFLKASSSLWRYSHYNVRIISYFLITYRL